MSFTWSIIQRADSDPLSGSMCPPLIRPAVSASAGLMISGFAQAGAALAEQGYVSRAAEAAAFLRTHLFDPDSGRLLRSCYRGKDNSVEQR